MIERRYRPIVVTSEEEALSMLQDGRTKEVFDYLYREHFDGIYRYLLYRCGGDQQLAEDLTNETFTKAMENIHRYRDEGRSFSSWLYRIAGNAFIDTVRKKNKRGPDVSLFYGSAGDELLPHGGGIDEDDIFTWGHIGAALKTMPEIQRDAIEGILVEGLSFPELSTSREVPQEAAKQRYFRGIDRLRAAVGIDKRTIKLRSGRTSKTKVE